ncbi:phage tail length tape measure family protein, partial [Comamonas sp.]|uniref:phage tail length tape measure family protein n=1 Tax=Comamonas sp. TaxID=34028 RepID=UPI00258774B0
MSALGSLVVKLALEYAQFSKGLDDSEQDVKKHAKKVQDAYDRMAGGIENRITSLRDTVIGALAGAISVAGVVSAIGKVRTETLAAEQEQKQLAAALQSTGQAAGWSQEKLNAMADSLAKNSNFSAGELNQAQARLLSYTGIVGQTFPRAMQAAADMSARMGTSVTASAESIGRALDIPSAGLTALTQQGFRFTDAQKNMVQQLERTGRVAEAQAIILQALEGSYGGAAAAARDSLGGALAAVGETINGLMTADSSSVPALRDSIEGLNDTLSSEAVRSAVQSLVGGIADLGSFAATTAAQVISLGTAVGQHSETIFALFSVIAGAGTALGIAKVVTALGGIAGGVTKVTAAWAALNVVMA